MHRPFVVSSIDINESTIDERGASNVSMPILCSSDSLSAVSTHSMPSKSMSVADILGTVSYFDFLCFCVLSSLDLYFLKHSNEPISSANIMMLIDIAMSAVIPTLTLSFVCSLLKILPVLSVVTFTVVPIEAVDVFTDSSVAPILSYTVGFSVGMIEGVVVGMDVGSPVAAFGECNGAAVGKAGNCGFNAEELSIITDVGVDVGFVFDTAYTGLTVG